MKIAIFRKNFYEYACQALEDIILTGQLELVFIAGKELEKESRPDINGVVTYRLEDEQLDRLPNLKVVLVPKTGLEDFNLKLMEAKGIAVINAHGKAQFIAERGFAIMMTLLGNIIKHNQGIKEGCWYRSGFEGQWTTFFDKKVGIYGYGHIGKAFHKMILPFTQQIYTINRNKDYPEDIKLVNSLESLSKQVDILFVSVPLNEKTENSIESNILKNMDNGFIINVGRGPVVNQKDLYVALSEGLLKGFGSDVWYNYPERNEELCFPVDFDSRKFSNLVMTPHNAWNIDIEENIIEEEMVECIRQLI